MVYVEMADAQRGPYAENQATLARLVQKKYLTEVDRRRILASVANLRMVCGSTYLLDKQTNVSPKLEELADLLRDLLGAGPHKVVVFSQWEMMLRKAAEVVEGLTLPGGAKVGYTVLHGDVPGKERRALLERFRDDPDCRGCLRAAAGAGAGGGAVPRSAGGRAGGAEGERPRPAVGEAGEGRADGAAGVAGAAAVAGADAARGGGAASSAAGRRWATALPTRGAR